MDNSGCIGIHARLPELAAIQQYAVKLAETGYGKRAGSCCNDTRYAVCRCYPYAFVFVKTHRLYVVGRQAAGAVNYSYYAASGICCYQALACAEPYCAVAAI